MKTEDPSKSFLAMSLFCPTLDCRCLKMQDPRCVLALASGLDRMT
jgi:hypothetical protein